VTEKNARQSVASDRIFSSCEAVHHNTPLRRIGGEACAGARTRPVVPVTEKRAGCLLFRHGLPDCALVQGS
jgi:hypothetical protein